MTLEQINTHREDARFLARLSLACWAGCLVLLLMFGFLGLLGLTAAALLALGGIASAIFAIRHALRSRDSISFAILGASIPIIIGVYWFGRGLFFWWHF